MRSPPWLEVEHGGRELRATSKSVLWQARLGAGSFSAARVAAARFEVDKLKLKRRETQRQRRT